LTNCSRRKSTDATQNKEDSARHRRIDEIDPQRTFGGDDDR